jgi:tRNA threonylcarbamoyladenosine biosynthesis protein TsaB
VILRIVALETATADGSVALLDGERVVEREVDLRREGAVEGLRRLLAEAKLEPEDVDAVAVSVGPGSFTGVRIGVAAAQGFCRGLDVPAVPVGTLEALAWAARKSDWDVPGALLLASVDARRAEVYAALYRGGARGGPPELLWGPEVLSCAALARRFAEMRLEAEGPEGTLVGSGAALLAPFFPAETGWQRPPSLSRARASAVARAGAWKLAAGETRSPAELRPVYLRKADAEITREKNRLPAG